MTSAIYTFRIKNPQLEIDLYFIWLIYTHLYWLEHEINIARLLFDYPQCSSVGELHTYLEQKLTRQKQRYWEHNYAYEFLGLTPDATSLMVVDHRLAQYPGINLTYNPSTGLQLAIGPLDT